MIENQLLNLVKNIFDSGYEIRNLRLSNRKMSGVLKKRDGFGHYYVADAATIQLEICQHQIDVLEASHIGNYRYNVRNKSGKFVSNKINN